MEMPLGVGDGAWDGAFCCDCYHRMDPSVAVCTRRAFPGGSRGSMGAHRVRIGFADLDRRKKTYFRPGFGLFGLAISIYSASRSKGSERGFGNDPVFPVALWFRRGKGTLKDKTRASAAALPSGRGRKVRAESNRCKRLGRPFVRRRRRIL